MEILKVSAKSNPNSVGRALAGVLREKDGAEIQAIGAGALNQAIKATAIAQRIRSSKRHRSRMYTGIYRYTDRGRREDRHQASRRTEIIHKQNKNTQAAGVSHTS